MTHSNEKNRLPSEGKGDLTMFKKIFSSPALRKLWIELATEAAKGTPIVGGMVTAADRLLRGLAAVEQEERENRLKAYVLGLETDFRDDIEFREMDVLPVMRKLAQDDETAKTEYYTRLTLNLGRTSIETLPSDIRYYFIRMVAGLTCYQIEFARELKIRKTVPVCGTLSLEEAELGQTTREGGMVLQTVNTLKNWGLLKVMMQPPHAKKPEGLLYEFTQDFDTLMGLLFQKDDFEPKWVNLQAKEKVDVIITEPYGSVDNLFEKHISTLLSRAGFTVTVELKNSHHLHEKIGRLYVQTGILNKNDKEYIQVYITRTGIPHYESPEGILRKFILEKEFYSRYENNSIYAIQKLKDELNRIADVIQILLSAEPHAF